MENYDGFLWAHQDVSKDMYEIVQSNMLQWLGHLEYMEDIKIAKKRQNWVGRNKGENFEED